VRQVIAATPEGARLVPAAPAMLAVLARAADELKQTGRPAG
jgi:DNA-binding transcriptional LysR family regulator